MRQLTMALTAIVVVVAAAVIALFLWLRTYAPLAVEEPITPGPGLGADIEPTLGSGGKTVFVPADTPGRPFEVVVTLANHGRFAVDVQAAVGSPAAPLRATLLTRSIHLQPHETSLATLSWRLSCPRGVAETSGDRVRLRYSYLSLFTKTQSVELPFAVTLRCHGGPPASP